MIPTAVLDRRNRIAAQLRAEREAANAASADTPVSAEFFDEAAEGLTDEAEAAELEETAGAEENDRSSVKVKDSLVEDLARKNVELAERLAYISEQIGRREPERTAKQEEPTEPDITVKVEDIQVPEEERNTFGSADRYIRALAREEIKRALNELLPAVNQIKNRVREVEAGVSGKLNKVSQQSFQTSLYAAVPDLDKLRGHPNFRSFLSKQVPYADYNMGTMLERAVKNQDLSVIVKAMDSFRKSVGGSAPTRDKFMSATSSGGAVNADRPAKKVLLASQRERDYKLFREGKMSPTDWYAKQEMYDRAIEENRYDPMR